MTSACERGQHPVLEYLEGFRASAIGELARERRIVDQPILRPARVGSPATVAISSAVTCSAGEAAPPPRSNSNRYFATVQPSSISPSTSTWHPHLVEEDLVLDLLAPRHHQRVDLDARDVMSIRTT